MSESPAANSGILSGVGSLIDEHIAMVTGPDFWRKLGERPPYYLRKGIYKLLKRNIPADADLRPLAPAVLARIARNFYRAGLTPGQTCSPENWRFELKRDYSLHTTSQEVRLEREWVRRQIETSWCNQIPVASGFTGPTSGKRRAIDLGWNINSESAVFVELKWDTNDPIYAAFEIFTYGILYVFARRFLTEHYRTTPWMGMKRVLLTVLTPAAFYDDYPRNVVAWLERQLNCAVATLTADHKDDPFRMGFCFAELRPEFKKGWTGAALDETILDVQAKLTNKMTSLFP
jgi:hypothetical protein